LVPEALPLIMKKVAIMELVFKEAHSLLITGEDLASFITEKETHLLLRTGKDLASVIMTKESYLLPAIREHPATLITIREPHLLLTTALFTADKLLATFALAYEF